MSQDQIQTHHAARQKCPDCGLVNSSADETCRRCGASFLAQAEPFAAREFPIVRPKGRTLLKRVTWILGTTGILLIIFYASLLLSSEGLSPDQREKVDHAIALLRARGFSTEAFALNRLTSFRSSDNWLNAYVGHHDAYAATNFPFEMVTLYPEFFAGPVDDCERAAVLLHEARHLLGKGEDDALEYTWKSKRQLGWTSEKYRQTRVWDATMRLTKSRFPYMFQCGYDQQQDCL